MGGTVRVLDVSRVWGVHELLHKCRAVDAVALGYLQISNTLPHAERVRGLGSRWSMGGWWCTIWRGIRCAGREGGQVFGAGRFLFGRGGQRVYLDGTVMWELDWRWRYR
jgi:hypothetical protein